MIQNSKSQTVAKNTGYMFLRMILVLLVSLYTSRVVLHVLGFEDFGIFNVVGSVVVSVDGREAARIPVVACDTVEARGLWPGLRRLWGGWILD